MNERKSGKDEYTFSKRRNECLSDLITCQMNRLGGKLRLAVGEVTNYIICRSPNDLNCFPGIDCFRGANNYLFHLHWSVVPTSLKFDGFEFSLTFWFGNEFVQIKNQTWNIFNKKFLSAILHVLRIGIVFFAHKQLHGNSMSTLARHRTLCPKIKPNLFSHF